MLKERSRIESILNHIHQLKSTVDSLKSEREHLLTKIETLEKRLNQRNEEKDTELRGDKEEMKQWINSQIAEIDTCLDLLKNV